MRAASDGSGNSSRRSASSAWSSSSRTSCSVPSSRPFWRACALALRDLAAQVVEAAQAVGAAAQQVAQRLARARAVEHLLADLVERGRDVVRRLERVAAARPGP